jgi:hypothetical protein
MQTPSWLDEDARRQARSTAAHEVSMKAASE